MTSNSIKLNVFLSNSNIFFLSKVNIFLNISVYVCKREYMYIYIRNLIQNSIEYAYLSCTIFIFLELFSLILLSILKANSRVWRRLFCRILMQIFRPVPHNFGAPRNVGKPYQILRKRYPRGESAL